MTKNNQKGMVPRLTTFFGTVKKRFISTKNILEGKIKTYYGPGQTPDVYFNYYPPNNWPKKGSTLHVPQMVWLTVSLHHWDEADHNFPPVFFDQTNFWYARYTNVAPFPYIISRGYNQKSSGEFSFFITHVSGFGFNLDGYEYSYSAPDDVTIYVDHPGSFPSNWEQIIANPYYPLHNNLLATFNEVKATLEQLRPNRTYVEVFDPWYPNPNQLPIPYKKYFPDHQDAPRLFPLIVPLDNQEYFGTHFLHIFIGSIVDTISTPTSFSFALEDRHLETYIARSQFDFASIMNRSGDQRDRFASYAVKMFGVDVTWEHYSGFTYPTSDIQPPDVSIACVDVEFTGFLQPPILTDVVHTFQWVRDADVDLFERSRQHHEQAVNASLQAIDDQHDAYDDVSNDWLHQIATDMSSAGYDVTFNGNSSNVTASNLIRLIAEHFRFDPNTGEDLPDD